MIKHEYLRYIKSRFNILILIAISLPVIISYYMTHMEKNDWKEQIALNPADLNIEGAKLTLEGYNGMAFLDRFLFSPDFYIVFVVILLIGFGIHLCAVTYYYINAGMGAIMVSKMGYTKYVLSLLTAQCLYIITFILGYFSLLALLSVILWGGYSDFLITGLGEVNGEYHLLMMLGHIILLIIYICLVVSATSLLTHVVKNKYLLQIMPFIFYFVTLIVSSFSGSVLYKLGYSVYQATWYFVSDHYLLGIYFYQASDAGFQSFVFSVVTLPSLLIIILLILSITNIKKYEKSYLL
ncbi:hypothetical protein MM221_08045 [Salipaludibacillus sp. LMS25]|uniref:hypothetical protein n=1 Tax=Salipaludibacillus sp. LMS25 TaxID=2924031 RepID=UPI0020D0B480|nr:hypothetical protein [Salipaludibacillus sp. LMS25]UTR16482.1 hypothetical protein MM221_08045 [Salipaludibacillus sp. LMS25]